MLEVFSWVVWECHEKRSRFIERASTQESTHKQQKMAEETISSMTFNVTLRHALVREECHKLQFPENGRHSSGLSHTKDIQGHEGVP